MDGIKYLLKVSAPVLLLVLVAVFAVRGCSLTQSYAPHLHPIYALERPWALIETPAGETPDIQSAADVPLWTLTPENLESIDLAVLGSFHEEGGPLALFLPENYPGFSDQLITSIKELGWEDRMIFFSPHDGLLRDLRADLPGALYSMGQGDTTQLFMLHALFLEPAAKLSADYLVAQPTFLGAGGVLPPRLLKELHRRKKALVIDLRESSDFDFSGLLADGYLIRLGSTHLKKLRVLRAKEGGQEIW